MANRGIPHRLANPQGIKSMSKHPMANPIDGPRRYTNEGERAFAKQTGSDGKRRTPPIHTDENEHLNPHEHMGTSKKKYKY